MSDGFKQYRRTQIAELRPWTPGDDMTRVSVSAADKEAGSPKEGDMIARNPKNHADQWLVAARYFADNFEPALDVEGYKVAYEPDFSKYPRLASILRPRRSLIEILIRVRQDLENAVDDGLEVNVYRKELEALLVDARADAVRFISDVKASELQKARTKAFDEVRGLLEIAAKGHDKLANEWAAAMAMTDRSLECNQDAVKAQVLRRFAEVFLPKEVQCEMRSSVTNVRCNLPAGHEAFSPTRFHRFPPKGE